MSYTTEGMRRLASAVLLQSLKDYKVKSQRDSVEYFINSGGCNFWLGIVGISRKNYIEAVLKGGEEDESLDGI